MSIHDQASSSLISTYRAFRVYTRKVGLVLTILFPGILVIALVINAFDPEILYNLIFQILWIFLVLNSLFFSVFSALHNYKFDKQIQDYTDIGLPINSTAGFKYSKNQIKNSLAISYWVTLSSVVSYAFYKLSGFYHTSDNNSEFIFSEILIFLAIGVSLISLSIFLSLDIPATYALEPGNLLSYYRPQIYPNAIDNILGDSAKLFLDPLSRYQFDDWTHDIGEKLNPAFEGRRTLENRVEIGIEKLILLMYLRLKMPKLVTEQLFQKELLTVIKPDKLNSFLLGEKSKLPFVLFEELVIKLQKEIPEIFTLVDRLLVELTVNPSRFEESDPYIELVAPDTHSSLNDPFRLFTYVLNLGKKAVRSRRIFIEASTSRELEPPYSKLRLELDSAEVKISQEIAKNKGNDLDSGVKIETIQLLAHMLQVGDAGWFQFIPMKFGNHLVNMSIYQEEKQIFGTTATITVKLSRRLRLQQLMRRLSGIGGIIIPALRVLIFVI